MFDQAFKRSHLAKAYCDALAGKGIVNSASGLFLAGPRRVGKSTFLIEDLIPEAIIRGWLAIYVDLWGNKQIDPAVLIMDAIKATISSQKSKLGQLSEQLRLKTINLFGTVSLNFSENTLPNNVTLFHLFDYLMQLTGKKILLVIDEAQHALMSKDGLNTMFSIKSARDQMNLSHQTNLMLVLTGSNRDKLAQLVIKKDQPFFGSEITAFPLLGHDYADYFTDNINKALAKDNQFDRNSVWDAFQLLGHRPEILRQIASKVAITHHAKTFSEVLKQDAFIWHSQIWQEYENDFNSLPVLQKAILALLIQDGKTFSPFSEKSLQFYKNFINQTTLAASSVQTAIQSLRDQGFIWQSSRGNYALEDEGFAEWFKHVKAHDLGKK